MSFNQLDQDLYLELDIQNPLCAKRGEQRTPIYNGDYSFNTGKWNALTLLDYGFVISSLVVSTFIAFAIYYKWRKSDDTEEYLMVGRSLSGVVAGLSITSSMISGITLTGIPISVYRKSTMVAYILVACTLSAWISTSVFIPVFYQLKLTSVHEYLELRFNKTVRTISFIFFVITVTVNGALVLYAPISSLTAVTGISEWGYLFGVGVICIIYTGIGSTRAVVYTDLFQFAIKLCGLIIVLVKANSVVGGVTTMTDSAKRTNRLILDNFNIDPRDNEAAWPIVIGGFHFVLYDLGLNQLFIHRCLSCRSLKDATQSIWLSAHLIWVFLFLSLLLGLYASTFYENCDPFKAKLIKQGPELIPFFTLDAMSDTNGVAGIYMAVILCATVSAMSTKLNTTAVTILDDLATLFKKAHHIMKNTRRIVQILTFGFGFICLEVAALAANVKGNIFLANQVFSGLLSSSIIAVFVMGFFLPMVTTTGALSGIATGTLYCIFIMLAQQPIEFHSGATICVSNCNTTIFPHVYDPVSVIPKQSKEIGFNFLLTIASQYTGVLSSMIAVVSGVVTSWCTGFQDPRKVDPVLIVPLLDTVFPLYYLPESIKEPFRFGIDHTHKWEKWKMIHEEDTYAFGASNESSENERAVPLEMFDY